MLQRPLEFAQYTSVAFGQRCRQAGVLPSMGSVGDAYDNAMCESFFATLECELLDREIFRTRSEAKLAIFNYIEVFYNRWRRHTGIGSVSPVAYEAAYDEAKPPNRALSRHLGGTSPQTPHLLSHASGETMAGQP
jgi:transposase InsO family protein